MPFVKRERKYYKYDLEDWTQPVLTANGELGSTGFACFSGSNYSGNPAYYAFDGKDTTAWASNLTNTQDYIGFYNPEPLLVTEIVCTNKSWITGFWEIYGSNSNKEFELLASGENTDTTDGSAFTIDLSGNKKAYNYYKIQCLTTLANSRVGMGEIKITAKKSVLRGTYTATEGWGNVANAFDGTADTYATCATTTDYIEYDFGKEVLVDGLIASGQFVSSGARAMNLRIYSVDSEGNEKLLGETTGCTNTATYTTKTNFVSTKTSRVRIRLSEVNQAGDPPLASVPTRIREIVITGNIEVPESSITDFGRTAYYKNVVTTKYWKEITTGSRELVYACYGGDGWYMYAKTPLGSDLTAYVKMDMGLASDISELVDDTSDPWRSVSEENAIWAFGNYSFPRYREGDLYIDTTVTETVEGTPDDYTYTTEEITTVEVDGYEDWQQPILTANNSDPNFVVSASSLQTSSSFQPWRSFKEDTTDSKCYVTSGAPTNENPMYYYITTDRPLKVSTITIKNRGTTVCAPIGIWQASEDNENWIDIVPFTAPNNKIGAIWSFETNEKIGYRYHRFKFTDKIGGSNLLTLGYPTLTAKILKEGFNESELIEGVDYDFTEFVPSTQYDYHVDNNKLYNLTRPHRDYYEYSTDYYIDRNVSYSIINPKNYKTLQISAVPNDAIITINNKERNSITAVKGSKITWSVKAEGYASQRGTVTLDEDVVLNITLNSSAYEDDQVVFESATTGTYELEIAQDGKYEVYCIGGGGGGAHHGTSGGGIGSSSKRVSSSGGSGSGFIGVVSLLAGSYNISVGGAGEYKGGTTPVRGSDGGDSYIDTFVIAYGGKGGYVPSITTNAGTPGAGGAIPSVTVETTVVTLNTQGNKGRTEYKTGSKTNPNLAGGASVYNGYGAGGTSGGNGAAGYVKIVWKG